MANNKPGVVDRNAIAMTHFQEMTYFVFNNDQEALINSQTDPNRRLNARTKLLKLTTNQFLELSADVYNELMRRKNQSNESILLLLLVL